MDNGDRCNSSRESGKLLGSSSQESHVSTPTSIESTMPLFKDPAGSNQGNTYTQCKAIKLSVALADTIILLITWFN